MPHGKIQPKLPVRQGGPCRFGAEVVERGGIDARAQSHDPVDVSPLPKGGPREKGRILDEIVASTLYARIYAALVLRQWGTIYWHVGPRGPLKLVAGAPRRPRRPAPRIYGEAVRKVLIHLWYLCDCMCGKCLVPAIRALLPVYQR